MLHALLSTNQSLAGLILRLTLAVVIFPHGAQKALAWFGGYGPTGTLGYFRSIGIPTPVGALVIATEFLGPLLLVLGLTSRLAALGIAAVMVGAAWKVHRPNGFFANWGGQLAAGKEGWEYHLLAVGLALGIILTGGGALSLDALLAR